MDVLLSIKGYKSWAPSRTSHKNFFYGST